jgi:hypothetical protein
MGSSAKKKREKKKDFQVPENFLQQSESKTNAVQKAKLKVGKTKPNHTVTSFKSKGTPRPIYHTRQY